MALTTMLLMEIRGLRMGKPNFWKAYREWNYITLVEPTGEWHRNRNIQKDNDTWKFEFKYSDSSWKIIGYEQVED